MPEREPTQPIPVEGDWVHYSDTGREAVLAEPGAVLETRAEQGSQPAKQIEHKLEELAKDYYLFSVAPVYYITGFQHDIVRLFLNDLGIAQCEYIAFVGQGPVFLCKGGWANVVQGLPWGVVRSTIDSNNNLFKIFVTSMELDERQQDMRRYWVIEAATVHVPTPGVVSQRTSVDLFLPSGGEYRVEAVVRPDGLVAFNKLPADPKVRARALEFYSRD